MSMYKKSRGVSNKDDDKEQLRVSFETFADLDGDYNTISIDQIGDLLRVLGQCPTNEHLDKFCANWKQSTDNSKEIRITFEEFLPIYDSMIKISETSPSITDYINCLSNFNVDDNGYVKGCELRHMLSRIGDHLTSDELDHILDGHEDNHGNVNIDQFVNSIVNIHHI